MPFKLNTELFLIPDADNYLVYAPLRSYVMRVPPAGVNLLVRIKKGKPRREDLKADFFKSLVKAGVINGKPETRPQTPVGKPYAPTSVTLLLTNRCNLACRYCYAGCQTQEMVMPEDVGKAAIDCAARNSVKKKVKVLELGFHGGGEPTMAWDRLTFFVDYARQVAQVRGLELRVSTATNACVSEAKAEWLAKNLAGVSVSLDGPPRIQNRWRPTRGGGASSPLVWRTLKILEAAKVPYGIQATVTKDTVREMPNMVRYVSRFLKPMLLKFEPVSACGRFLKHESRVPPDGEFSHFFNQAFEIGAGKGVNVGFSGVRLPGPNTSYFCGAICEPFTITPDGHVTACFEAYSAEAAHADTMIVGLFDRHRRRFVVDRRKVDALRTRHVYNLAGCERCFCKYSCAGDCLARNLRYAGTEDLEATGVRCEAIREITRHRLVWLLSEAAKHAVTQEKNHGRTRQPARIRAQDRRQPKARAGAR